jgi:hypothetical protein
MKRLLGAVLLVTVLNGCAQLPLVSNLGGSLSINGAIAGVTGNYERQGVSAVINLASHKSTGKTVSQHLYAAVENKYTKKRLKKHFKNNELSIADFQIADKSIGDYFPSKQNLSFVTNYKPSFLSSKRKEIKVSNVKWQLQGFNYRVYDTSQPNFEVN